jgi:hypothetical protein
MDHRDPVLATATSGDILHPHQRVETPDPLDKGRKEVTGTTTRILQGVTYPTYPSLKNTARATREKNKQLEEHRILKP